MNIMLLKKAEKDIMSAVMISRKLKIRKRPDDFINHVWEEKHVRRLWKRLKQHRDELLTFLDHKEVPPDNNGRERAIRPAFLIRKNIFANGSDAWAQTQAIFMTIMHTLKMRSHNPVQVLVDALKNHVRWAQLPSLQQKSWLEVKVKGHECGFIF